jgi:peptidoglycan/xylan/chitin deacetylase (PgdA/CDA1 family)
VTGSGNHLTALARTVRQLGVGVRNSTLAERVLARIPSGGGVVLRYHSVGDDPGWAGDYLQPSLGVSPAVFDRQIAHVCRTHRVIGLGELVDALRKGRPIDRRSVVITFDDGYEDNYRNAFPILKRHGATATFYITAGAVADEEILWTVRLRYSVMRSPENALSLPALGERPLDLSNGDAREDAVRLLTARVKRCRAEEAARLLSEIYARCGVSFDRDERRVSMNRDELKEMLGSGMTIGAHTVNHYNLPSLEPAELAREIGESKRLMEDALDARVDHFAYPNGRTDLHFDRAVARAVAAAGFASAATSVEGAVTPGCSEFAIPRLGVRKRHWNVRRFATDVELARFARHTHAFSTREVLDRDGTARPRV